MDNLTRSLIRYMAQATGTELTERHWRLLNFAYAYYDEHQVPPMYRIIEARTGADRSEVETLFPHGLNSLYTWVQIPIHTTDKGCKTPAEISVSGKREVYLDYNATTPVRPEVARALGAFYADPFSYGNPSSSSTLGRMAYRIVHTARQRVAGLLDADPDRIVFTSCGTEANNMVLKHLALDRMGGRGHLITSQTEHPSVLQTAQHLESRGVDVTWLSPGPTGAVRPEDVEKALRPDTFLVSVMAANNEIGSVTDLAAIGSLCRAANVPFMSDAVQAYGKIPLRPERMGISYLSLSGHKIYAPKGVGALYVSPGAPLGPLLHGGDQEGGLRAGTENVGSIHALGLAAQLAGQEMAEESARLAGLRDEFLARLQKVEPELIVNGSMENRLPNNLNVGFPFIDGGALLLSLNRIGVFVTSTSACHAGSKDASHVIRALGVDTERYGIVRFSFGRDTTREDLDYVLTYLPEVLRKLRSREG